MSKYPGLFISDWNKVNINNPKHKRYVMGALQSFLRLPETVPAFRKQAQAFARTGKVESVQSFATKDDFPDTVREVLDKYHAVSYFDRGYEEIFDVKDMRNADRDGFKVNDVESGLTFSKTEIGERAKLYKMSGTQVTVTSNIYSGGLHWHKTLFDDKEYWTLEDNAIEFMNTAYSSKAQDYYDLIDAVGSTYDLTWQTGKDSLSSGTLGYTVQRDVATLNTAAVNIINRTKDLGMGVGPATELIVLAPIELMDRLTDAMSNKFQAFGASPSRINYNFRPIFTTMLADSTKYYVILPKNKLKGINRMDLTIMTDMDITTYSELAVGWMRYGGSILESKQIVRCNTE